MVEINWPYLMLLDFHVQKPFDFLSCYDSLGNEEPFSSKDKRILLEVAGFFTGHLGFSNYFCIASEVASLL